MYTERGLTGFWPETNCPQRYRDHLDTTPRSADWQAAQSSRNSQLPALSSAFAELSRRQSGTRNRECHLGVSLKIPPATRRRHSRWDQVAFRPRLMTQQMSAPCITLTE